MFGHLPFVEKRDKMQTIICFGSCAVICVFFFGSNSICLKLYIWVRTHIHHIFVLSDIFLYKFNYIAIAFWFYTALCSFSLHYFFLSAMSFLAKATKLKTFINPFGIVRIVYWLIWGFCFIIGLHFAASIRKQFMACFSRKLLHRTFFSSNFHLNSYWLNL